MPVDVLAEIAADQRRDQRADIDPHVEDGEAGVAPRVVLGVERADQGADVGLEQPGADHDQREPEIERCERAG